MTTTMKTPAKFSMAVKTAAKAGRISQAEIGTALGLSREAVAMRLAARIRWNLNEVDVIAELFDVDPVAMLAGLGDWWMAIDPVDVRRRLEAMAPVSLNHHCMAGAAIASIGPIAL